MDRILTNWILALARRAVRLVHIFWRRGSAAGQSLYWYVDGVSDYVRPSGGLVEFFHNVCSVRFHITYDVYKIIDRNPKLLDNCPDIFTADRINVSYCKADLSGYLPTDLRNNGGRRGLPPTHLYEHRFDSLYPETPYIEQPPCLRFARRYHEGQRKLALRAIDRFLSSKDCECSEDLVDEIALCLNMWRFPDRDILDFGLR